MRQTLSRKGRGEPRAQPPCARGWSRPERGSRCRLATTGRWSA